MAGSPSFDFLSRFTPHRHRSLADRLLALSADLQPFARALLHPGSAEEQRDRGPAGEIAHTAGKVAGSLARRGGDALHEAGELAHGAGELAQDLVQRVAPAAERLGRELGQQALLAGRNVRRDPVPALVALTTAALIARLLLSRR